jgi:hypothetical protein
VARKGECLSPKDLCTVFEVQEANLIMCLSAWRGVLVTTTMLLLNHAGELSYQHLTHFYHCEVFLKNKKYQALTECFWQ